MKKLLFVLALAGFTASAQAQTEAQTVAPAEVPTVKYSVMTNSFWSNWFIGVGFDAQSHYGDQERAGVALSKSPFKGGRIGLGGDIQLGKWFTPGIGVRLRGHVGSARVPLGFEESEELPEAIIGHDAKFDPELTWSGTGSHMAFNVQIQTMFNLNNLICGYNPNRVWTISPYVGFGFAHHMAHRGDWSHVYSCGLYNQFNLSKRCFISLDLYAETFTGEFDGTTLPGRNENLTDTRDTDYGVSLGFGVNLGKTGWQKTPDVKAIMDLHEQQMQGLKSQIENQEKENENLKRLIAQRKPETREIVVREVVPGTPASVFFNINSAKVASKKDLVNVQAIVDAAKANGSKIVVTGYADSKTGTAAYNQTLSEKRANTVADIIADMGIARENIIVEAKGGVNDITPYSYNRRVIVKIQ